MESRQRHRRLRGVAGGRSRLRTLSAIVLLLAAGLWAYRIAWWVYESTVSEKVLSHRSIIERWSGTYDLPVELVEAVIRVESAGRADAVSGKKAKGLMQVTDDAERDVVRRFGISRRRDDDRFFDPRYNIQIGMAYLRLMIDRFDGDVYAALAAYNMGPTKLRRLLNSNPGLSAREVIQRDAPAETKDYCRKIFQLTGGRYTRLPVSGTDAPVATTSGGG